MNKTEAEQAEAKLTWEAVEEANRTLSDPAERKRYDSGAADVMPGLGDLISVFEEGGFIDQIFGPGTSGGGGGTVTVEVDDTA